MDSLYLTKPWFVDSKAEVSLFIESISPEETGCIDYINCKITLPDRVKTINLKKIFKG
ncbi:MAG: hypothetical protein WBH76_07515 [Dictyoglomaceae bacterium]